MRSYICIMLKREDTHEGIPERWFQPEDERDPDCRRVESDRGQGFLTKNYDLKFESMKNEKKNDSKINKNTLLHFVNENDINRAIDKLERIYNLR